MENSEIPPSPPILLKLKSYEYPNLNPSQAWEGFKFGYSYDFNLSKIGGDGGISEFSITYDFLNNKDCFGCPEY